MKQVVIWDEQREYAMRLMQYLNQRANGLFIVLLVQNQEELMSLLEQGSIVYLLVAEEFHVQAEELRKLHKEKQQGTIIYWGELTEQPVVKAYQLYRYSSAEWIYEQLAHKLIGNTVTGKEGGLQVLGVYALQDTVVVRRYAREQLASFSEIFWEMTVCSDYEGDFYPAEQLLFAIKMREAELKDALAQYLIRLEMGFMISGLSQFFDGRQLALEDYLWFFDQLYQAGYEKLYLYIDFSMIQEPSFFSCLSQLWILSEPGCESRKQHLLQMLQLMGVPKEKQVEITL